MPLKLKLFSGEARGQQFIDDLASLLALDNSKINDIVHAAKMFVNSNDTTFITTLDRELGVKFSQVATYVSVLTKVAARVLAGINSAEVIADLASQGLPRDKIEHLFSTLMSLDDTTKSQFRAWSVAREVNLRHIHSMHSEVLFRTLTDNANPIGTVPILYLSVGVWNPDKRRSEVCTIEFTKPEIQSLEKTLDLGRKELEASVARIKSNPNNLLVG